MEKETNNFKHCFEHETRIIKVEHEMQAFIETNNIKNQSMEDTISQLHSEYQNVQSILETLGNSVQRIEFVLTGTMGTDGFIKDYAETKKTVNFLNKAVWFVTVLPAVLAGIGVVLQYFK